MNKLAPFNPSNDAVITKALELLAPTAKDILYDIGCGDARLLVQAARQIEGLQCVGIEYDDTFVHRAHVRIEEAGLHDRITVLHADALTVDLSSATMVFMYLVPTGLRLILPKIQALKQKGVRFVTYMFAISDWSPTEIRSYKGTKIYYYA